MSGFLPDAFLARAALVAIAVALVAAPLGCFVVWRRMAYFGATVAHSGLLGVALGLWLAMDLTLAVLVVALAISALLVLLERRSPLPRDTLLGILAHGALAAGLIATALLKGAQVDLMAVLFGDMFAVSDGDIAWAVGGGMLVLAALARLWRPLLALSVHEELAAAEGIAVARAKMGFIVLLALTVAVAMKIVGILLIVSLLIIPAASARPLARTPEQMALIAAGIALAGVGGGLALALGLDAPGGPSIALALVALFALTRLARRW